MTTTVEAIERKAICDGLVWMRLANPGAALAVLTIAAAATDALAVALAMALAPVLDCDWCGGPVLEPVRDPEQVSWQRAGAPTYCRQKCMDESDERRIGAAGGPR